MFCRNCGNEVNENAAACLSCGADPKRGENFCPNCGVKTNANQVICTACGVSLKNTGSVGGIGSSSKMLIGLLACIPGISDFGIHYYLMHDMKKFKLNIIVLIVSFVACFLFGIGTLGLLGLWIYNLIFGINVLTGKITEDAEGNPLT